MSINNHTVTIKTDGSVWGCGNNSYGQLGLGYTSNSEFDEKEIKELKGLVKSVVHSYTHTLFLMNDGTVKGCGTNGRGQLGIGNTTNQNNIVNIPIDGVRDISCGYAHTIFLMNDGTVKGCGANSYGQLGIESTGNTTNQNRIIDIPITGVGNISCGYDHTIFLMNDGTIKGCGQNSLGQLGIGNTTSQNKPIDIPVVDVKDVSCGSNYTIFLMNDGTVKGCGYNNNGQLGIGNTTQVISVISDIPLMKVDRIICGDSHTMFLMNDGTTKGCGRNDYGQLCIGNTRDQTSIVAIPIIEITDIVCGYSHTMFLMQDGTVRGCGRNDYGQLGNPAPMLFIKPIRNNFFMRLLNPIVDTLKDIIKVSFDLETDAKGKLRQKIVNNDTGEIIETRDLN